MCEACRHTMQKSRLIVTETGESVRKNFEITCYGEHISLGFRSGKRQNKIVVQMVEGEIHDRFTDRSWWEKLKELLKSTWSGILRVVLGVAGAIVGFILGGPAGLLAGAPLLKALANII